MEDLAALSDVTGPAVLNTLSERFQQGQYYTYCGEFLLSFNPCHDVRENESELGQLYRASKPLKELPPHVVDIAHRAFRMLVNDVLPQAIVIAGRPGSGKSEAARRIISQLLREARLSPVSGLEPRLIMAQHILNTLISAGTVHNNDSTRAIKMATLLFRHDGHMISAELQALCVEKWFLVDRGNGSGNFSIFYAMMAGLTQQELHLYYLVDKYRLLSRNDMSSIFNSREDHTHYFNMFDFFMTSIEQIGIVEQTHNYEGRAQSAIIAVLAAILHLGNLDVTVNPPTNQPVISNPHELRAASDLLSVPQDRLEAEILSSLAMVQGEWIRMTCSVEQSMWNRDLLIVQLYRRLVRLVTTRLNTALAPDTHYMDHGPLTPVHVVESVGQEQDKTNAGLEAFCRNMAAERIKYHLYDVIFTRDVETCEREKVQAYKIKFSDNTELISVVFGPDYGIMNKITTVTMDPQGSPEKLVKLMDNDRSLKKTGSYVNSGKAVKSSEVFFIKHGAIGQMTYCARDFIRKNRAALSDSARQMMLHDCRNPLLSAMARMDDNETGYPPDITSPDANFATRAFQSDLSYLIQTLDNAKLHHIRCLQANSTKTAGVFDSGLVTEQLKDSSVVETTRQRKFGFSHCMSQDQFVRCYRDLAYSAFSRVPSVPEACKVILHKTGLHGRGVSLSKSSVFLRYWHVHRLLALRDELSRRVVVVQSLVRGFLARRRTRGFFKRSPYRRQFSSQKAPQRSEFPYQQDRVQSPTSPSRYGNGVSRGHSYSSRESEGREYPGYLKDSSSSIVADDPAGLYTQIIGKVLTSLHTLESTTWGKIIYMEKGRQVAKMYADDKSIIIDGSHVQFDGERLGLGALRNEARDEEIAFFRSSILEGVRLKHDSYGNILACRLCDQPIIVKGLDDPDSGACLAADVIVNRGQLPLEKTIKVFDMMEFRSKVALDIKKRRFSVEKMRRACVIGLCFGRDDSDDVMTPCWLCIVNVKALVSLDSDDLIREAQQYSARLEVASLDVAHDKMREDEAKSRHLKGKWARTDQRQHLQEKEEGSRHVRQQLRAKGLEIGQHVGYSWQYDRGADKTTMEDLHHWMEPGRQAGRSRDSGNVRDWAKVETAVREETRTTVVGMRRQSSSDFQ